MRSHTAVVGQRGLRQIRMYFLGYEKNLVVLHPGVKVFEVEDIKTEKRDSE